MLRQIRQFMSCVSQQNISKYASVLMYIIYSDIVLCVTVNLALAGD